MAATKLSSDSFLTLVRQSGLLEQEQLKKFLQTRQEPGAESDDVSRLADEMVNNNLLTRWQVDKLLAGKSKGFTLGKYRILSHLGSGGMSAVYLAEHVLMRRRVAIKVLPKARVEDSSYLERFHREAQAVAALDHSNIVRAYDVSQEDNVHFLVMEYVPGKSLQEMVATDGPFSYVDAADYIRQAAEGLGAAHDAGMVHRDIKPGNLLVDKKGVVKILDLGLAMFYESKDDNPLTIRHDEKVLGTADYLSPEQALDSHTVDIRADIYSLGCTLYFMLTGHPPFPDGTLAQRLLAHQTRQPAPIEAERKDIPPGLLAIVNKMMQKKPADRFQTSREAADALTKWLAERGDPAWRERYPYLAGGTGSDILSKGTPPPVAKPVAQPVVAKPVVASPTPPPAPSKPAAAVATPAKPAAAKPVATPAAAPRPAVAVAASAPKPVVATKPAPAPAAAKASPAAPVAPAVVAATAAIAPPAAPAAPPANDEMSSFFAGLQTSDAAPEAPAFPMIDTSPKKKPAAAAPAPPKPSAPAVAVVAVPTAPPAVPVVATPAPPPAAPARPAPAPIVAAVAPAAAEPTLVAEPAEATVVMNPQPGGFPFPQEEETVAEFPDFSFSHAPAPRTATLAPPAQAAVPVAAAAPAVAVATPAGKPKKGKKGPSINLVDLLQQNRKLVIYAVSGLALLVVVWIAWGIFGSTAPTPNKPLKKGTKPKAIVKPKPEDEEEEVQEPEPAKAAPQKVGRGMLRRRAIDVGPGKKFSTIAQGLADAKLHAGEMSSSPTAMQTITIAAGTYAERIVVDGTLKHVRLVVPEGEAILSPADAGPAIEIKGVEKFEIEGFRVEAAGKEVGIQLSEALEGTKLKRITVNGFTKNGILAIGAIAYNKRLQIENITLRPGNAEAVGIRLNQPSNIDLIGCRLIGPMATGLQIDSSAMYTTVRESIFSETVAGVKFTGSSQLRQIVFANNTFYKNAQGIVFEEQPLPGTSDLAFYNNLFAQVQGPEVQVKKDLKLDAFGAMLRTVGAGAANNWSDRNAPVAAGGDPTDYWPIFETNLGGKRGGVEFKFASADPTSPDYLAPTADSPQKTAGQVEQYKPFVGALGPK